MKSDAFKKATGKRQAKPRTLNLALQGGGAHGAFTWGVLDRLLEEVEQGNLEIDGLSGTSAGALNATVMKYGLLTGGPQRARELLDQLWQGVSASNVMTPLQEFTTRAMGDPNLDKVPFFAMLDFWKSMGSPQQFNPWDQNPLRDLLTDLVDFDELGALLAQEEHDDLYIGATNVSRGDLKIFHGDEITVDAVMASATLPDVFHPVEIDGELFWDGGYMGNPPLEPLRFQTDSDDILLVQINGFKRTDAPRSRDQINDAANHLMFNSTLVAELRDLERMNKLFEKGLLKPSEQVRPQRLHRIRADGPMDALNHSSKGNTAPSFLTGLKELGRATAEQWLKEAGPKLGKETTWGFDWSNPVELNGKSAPREDAKPAPKKRKGRNPKIAPERRTHLQEAASRILGDAEPAPAPTPRRVAGLGGGP
ncbi:MAG: patatin-like phospholipase family protein [Pseudomonadota bacterium]